MQPTNKTKKLLLKTESVRQLTASELTEVQGGGSARPTVNVVCTVKPTQKCPSA